MSDDASVKAFIGRIKGGWALYAGTNDELAEIVRVGAIGMFGFQVSGDGKKLVYVGPETSSVNQVLCRDIATGKVREVTPLENKGFKNPKISGDGTTIAYNSGVRDIWVAHPNGERKMMMGEGEVCALTHDGSKLAVLDKYGDDRLDIYDTRTGRIKHRSHTLNKRGNDNWVISKSVDISASGKQVIYLRNGYKKGFCYTSFVDENEMFGSEPTLVVDGHKDWHMSGAISITNDGKYVGYTRYDGKGNQMVCFCDNVLGKAYHYPSEKILADAGIGSSFSGKIDYAVISGDGKKLFGAAWSGKYDQTGKLVEFDLERDRKTGDSIVVK